MTSRRIASALVAILLSGSARAQKALESTQPSTADKARSTHELVAGGPRTDLDPDMRHVITALSSLGPRPLQDLDASDARHQPSAADAAMEVLREEGKSTLPDPGVTMKNILIDGARNKIVATVYRPAEASGTLPVIVYYHGGGFVVANNATYAASCIELAKGVGAMVVEVEYSKAPEYKFPASHADAVAAYSWVVNDIADLGGDPKRIALAGESAGGNLVVNVAIAAREFGLPRPVHELVIYPMAGTDLDTPSYKATASGSLMPLNKPMMAWFYAQLTNTPSDLSDARLDIVGKADLRDLPPTTVITAEIDPLHDEGVALAHKLEKAGVKVDAHDFAGVTHGFFGMGRVVGKAKQAEDIAIRSLQRAFGAP